ncbi:DNA-binding transcriptional LysR family regulator [Inhella inkyongensis]|uniref:DNA-binding transcriptional LysR family regulator n=1 Tax=Inhella inkyongensis TaxID=392593 RepID=A0A840RW15_9BURK|nr:LysR substrate-binding domain-containing protein [Inhella inkyongensis]MBB5202867.1 DNA-binding transcriptional LysR family regulator [Inhella inkyongensis]
MDKIQLIQTFLAVVQEGGFAGAARSLSVSPPVVTRAINELEERLGVRLLTRTTRIVKVTPAGSQYAADCQRILEDLRVAEELACGLHGQAKGELKLTAPGWFGAKFLAPLVAEFLLAHPQVSAQCLFMDRVVNLLEEGVDVALRFAALPDSTMQAIPVGRMRVVTVAAPAYLARRGRPRRPDDLQVHETVASSVAPGMELRFRVDGQPHVVRVNPRLLCTTNEAVVAAAVAGFGVAQQMLYKVADPLAAGQLVPVLEDFEPPPLPVNLLHREGRFGSLKVRSFLDFAAAGLRQLPVLQA